MTKNKKIEEKYTADDFIDKVFEENVNSSYQEIIEAMVKAIDEVKYDEDVIEDDLISEAAVSIADAYGKDIASTYDDLIDAQEDKYANKSHYPDADDLEGTYGGALDEKDDNKFNDFGKTWSVFKTHMHGSEPEQEVAKGLSSREAAGKVTSLRAAEKDKDISYISRSAENDKFIKDHQKPINNNSLKESDDDLAKVRDAIKGLKFGEEKSSHIGDFWIYTHVHNANFGSHWESKEVSTIQLNQGHENIALFQDAEDENEFETYKQELLDDLDSIVIEEDYHNRQKSIRCLKDLGKNYNFDRFSDQQLYVMCKKEQVKAKKIAQEQTEMENELENCPEAQTCPQCGGPLNDAGECPKCDLGDENESLKAEDTKKYNYKSDEVDDMLYALAARNDLYKVEVECNGNSVTLNDLYTLGKAVVAAKEEIVDEINNIG